jgi:four helix bundle protein
LKEGAGDWGLGAGRKLIVVISSYRDLEVWKSSVQLSLSIYKLTSKFPENERFGLTSQMRRCSVSIPSKIAEGHARLSTREYLRYISIALGSLAELETQLVIAGELSIASTADKAALLTTTDRLGKQLRSLVKSLRSKLNHAQP